jgi:hypothetical protein
MTEHPTEDEIKRRLQSTVSRPHRYKQGDTIYGVTEFNNDPPSGSGWAGGGKIFEEKSRAEKYYSDENPLRNPDIPDTVLYKGTVAISDNIGRDTIVVDPSEETEIILTDIHILARRKPGENPN